MNTTAPREHAHADSPRARGKRQAVLAAAARLFREHGYGDASMDAVAERAGVSKATLYAYFPGKHELFAAVIQQEGDQKSAGLLTEPRPGDPLRTRLLRHGRAVLDLLLAEETLSSYRMVAAEAARAPELGRLYYENGAARLHARLEQVIEAAMRAGELRRGPADVAAAQFIGLVRGDLMLRALLCVERVASARERQASVRAGVDSFCRAWGAGGPQVAP